MKKWFVLLFSSECGLKEEGIVGGSQLISVQGQGRLSPLLTGRAGGGS